MVAAAASPITHVIEIMLENHSFDSLFGGLPGVGVPPGTTLPSPDAGGRPVAPFVAPPNEGEVQGGLNNARSAELAMMDRAGGTWRMDGYTRYPGEGLSSITRFAPSVDPNLQYLAHRYELATGNFQPDIAPTLPNVLYALAGTSHGAATNAVPAVGTWRSIFDELSAAHRTWRIYSGVSPSIYAGTVWDRLLPPGSATGIVPATRLLSDLAAGRLPSFSLVRPGVGYSEEPPEDVGEGDAWLGQLLAAIGRSRSWPSTAVFITYDEGGGFYDHLPPPVVPGSGGYGTRTPLVVVSPWARRTVLTATTTNLSVLSFVQHLFRLPPLDRLNAEQDDLAAAFDYAQRPLPPPRPPVDPPTTVGFTGSSPLADVPAVPPGRALTVRLEINTAGLALDRSATGTVALSVTPPAGTPRPIGIPATVTVRDGQGSLALRVDRPGYYRLRATGPGGSLGWLTLDVGVGPNTP